MPVCPVCGNMVKWTKEDDINEQVLSAYIVLYGFIPELLSTSTEL